MSKLIDALDQASLRTDVPAFRPGDSVKVHVKVVEGNRSRSRSSPAWSSRRAGDGVREAFTVRKVSFGVGVERTFPVHSPIIDKIEIERRGDVRRAKLYYLRGLRGKAAKIKEKRDAQLSGRPAAADGRPRIAHDTAVDHGAPARPYLGGPDRRGHPDTTRRTADQGCTFGQHAVAFVSELLAVVIGAVIVASLLRGFVGQMFLIPSISMENTLQIDDRVVVEKLSSIKRGQVVVFARSRRLVDAAVVPTERGTGRSGPAVRGGAARHQHRAPDQAGGRHAGRPRRLLRRRGPDHGQRPAAGRDVLPLRGRRTASRPIRRGSVRRGRAGGPDLRARRQPRGTAATRGVTSTKCSAGRSRGRMRSCPKTWWSVGRSPWSGPSADAHGWPFPRYAGVPVPVEPAPGPARDQGRTRGQLLRARVADTTATRGRDEGSR